MPAKAKAKQAKVDAKNAASKPVNKTPAKSVDKSPPKPIAASKSKVKAKPSSPAKQPTKVSPSKAPAPKRSAPVDDTKKDGANGVKKTKSEEQIVKVITKGGAAVDALVPNKDSYRVFQDGGKTYSATLNQSNLSDNNNKFYIIQVLQHEANGNIFVWNRWGRVGVPGQNALKGPMPKDAAIRDFNSKHHDKTVKGDYREI